MTPSAVPAAFEAVEAFSVGSKCSVASKRLISCSNYSSRLANVASAHVTGQLADRDTGVGSAKGGEP